MDKLLCDALGLPETATLQEGLDKIQTLKDAGTAAATDLQKAEAACRKAKCDAFIAAHKAQITDEAKFRTAYEAAPEATEAAFGVFKAAPVKPGQTRIMASQAQTPDSTLASATVVAERRTQQTTAVAACRASNPGMTCREAEAICRRQNPALFTTAAE